MKAVVWLVGGISAASGIALAANGGFGLPSGGATATEFASVGSDALEVITVHSNGMMAIGLFLFGVALMAFTSAGAYKETGGY